MQTITGRLVRTYRSVREGDRRGKMEGSVDHRCDLGYQPEEITVGGGERGLWKGRRA